MTAIHESWEYRDWPHPGYVCKGCASDLTYDEAMTHRRCTPQLSGRSESTVLEDGEAAPRSRVASDSRATSPVFPSVDPATHGPGKGEEPVDLSGLRTASEGNTAPSVPSLAEASQRAEHNDGAGTGTSEGFGPVPVPLVDLIPKLREAFPDGLPVRGSTGMFGGEASR